MDKIEKCQMCGKELRYEKDIRYQVTIEIKSCYDPLTITQEDLFEDYEDEIKDLIKKMSKMSKEELEEEVYKKFQFFICLKCQKKYVKDPLFKNHFKIILQPESMN